MISIVLPVYNGEKYLSKALDSIINQTYDEWELIVVNDCSTDNSLNIIKDYCKKDQRIKVINNETNKKLPCSLNIGFAHCSGNYFTWTSDDNLMLPKCLETLLDTLKRTESDLVFSRCETIDETGKVTGITELYNDLNELYYNNIVLASFLYKKEVHEKLGGYDETRFLVEDYDFWLRAYKEFKFSFISDPLYQIRFHKENLGTLKLENVKLKKIELLKENMQEVNDEKIIDKINTEISLCYYEISNLYYIKLITSRNKKKIIERLVKEVIKKALKKQ